MLCNGFFQNIVLELFSLGPTSSPWPQNITEIIEGFGRLTRTSFAELIVQLREWGLQTDLFLGSTDTTDRANPKHIFEGVLYLCIDVCRLVRETCKRL
ncbi:hypothetical protein AAC387_Pa12g2363 [Persea americana]